MRNHYKPRIKPSRKLVIEFKTKLSFFLLSMMTIILQGNTWHPSSLNDEKINYNIKDVPISHNIVEIATSEKQQNFVSGTIVDNNGAPLPGASIMIKNTSIGVISDFNGNYTIAVPENGKIMIFSYLGFKTTEVAINDRSKIDIQMEMDAAQLDDVVVIGYGTQKRSDITGSISKVDMSTMEGLPTTNVTQAMRGRVAGLQFTDSGRPGQYGSLIIRGKGSITASNEPLIILDGSFFYGSLSDLNPNDIKSLTVLKDASSTAIYGSKAANGVILITSKMGTSSEPIIKINSYYGVQEFSHKLPILTAERYIQKTLDFRKQSGQEAEPNDIESYLQPTEAINFRNNKIIDPWEIVSQNSFVTSNDISISGKSNSSSYLFSLGRMEEKGLIYNDNFKRITARINLNTDINDWIKVGVNAMLTNNDLSGVNASTGQAYQLSPYGQIYLDEEEKVLNRFPSDDQLSINPLLGPFYLENEDKSSKLFSTLFAEVEIPFIKNLKYKINYSPNYIWSHQYNFTPIIKDQWVNTTGSASKSDQKIFNWVLENILTYRDVIGENHSFDATLLYGRNSNNYSATTASASNFFNDGNGWNNLGLAEVQTTSSDATNSEGISSMFRLNYQYKNKYSLTITARKDGDSVFGENNKYATLPSAAIAWNVSEEGFFNANESWINYLKLRLSHGITGNQAISPYQSLSQSSTNSYVFGDGGQTSIGIHPSKLANSGLSWETTISSNIGFDFGLIKNKINGAIELYNMKTKDLLLNRSLPSLTGFSNVITNLGEINNKGVELTLNASILTKDKFEWFSNFVFSHNKNKIVHLYGSDLDGDGREDDDLGNRWFIGQPISVNYDYVIDGIYQVGDDIPTGSSPGSVRLKDLDGVDGISTDDRKVISQQDPKYRWGLTNEFKYGNFKLSIFMNALTGWSANNRILDLAATNNFPGRAVNMTDIGWWNEENKSKTRPSLVYTNPKGHGFYESRSFVRIQDVSLSYQFPDKLLKNNGIKDFRIYLSGRNLHTFTKWSGWDPESGYSDSTGFPSPRTLAIGLSTSF